MPVILVLLSFLAVARGAMMHCQHQFCSVKSLLYILVNSPGGLNWREELIQV